MPGNEHGDRVHNFFAQDNTSQVHLQSHVLEGNWPVPNNNFWVGSQRQNDVLNSRSKQFPAQNSEIDRGETSYPVHASHHSLNFSQSNLRPNISKSQYINEQQYLNGVAYGNQINQNRQNEANFLAMDTDSNHRSLISSRSSSIQEAQQESVQEQEKASYRMKISIAPTSFDLFGGQPQMNHQQASMLHALQRQQSGINDMQQMQQQFMIRKMQESQMQQQQLDLRPEDLVNQGPRFSKQKPGSQSSNLVNGTSNSDSLQYPLTAEPGTNWLNRGSSVMQGPSSGHGFSPNLAQTHQLIELVPQQADQSLYGVPISNSRGLAVNQYTQMVTDRSSMLPVSPFRNSLNGGQHNILSYQIGGQEGTSISRPKIKNENIGHVSGQSLNTVMLDRPPLQQTNSMQRNANQQHFTGRQELATQLETLQKKSTGQFLSSPNEVALDPAEEKILFGSDDNLWSAFGKRSNMSGEASNLFDNSGLSNGFPSLQSGSWSALMQSAVAETSSSDIGPQEEWSGLNIYNADGSSANQHTLMHNDYVKEASLPNDDVRIPPATNSGSIRSSEDINIMGSNQLGHKFQNESGTRVLTDISQTFRESLDEASKWSNSSSTLQKSVAEGSQKYGNAPQHSLDAEGTTKKLSATWVPGKTGTKLEQNGWNALAAVPPGGDRLLTNHEAELSQNSPNNRLMVMQGGLHGSSLWKSNSVTSSANEFFPVKVGNHLADKGLLSLNDASASASVPNSCNTGVGNGTSSFIQNNDLLHQWKSAYPPANFQESEDCGGMQDQVNEQNQGLDSFTRGGKYEARRHDIDSCAMKENSNDSHHSNLSHHASGGHIEVGLSDSSDSRSLPPAKQKLTRQLSSKVSVPRKFQYHPLGNLAEDAEPSFGMKQHTLVQARSLHNTQSGQLSQVIRYSAAKDKGEFPKENKGTNEEPSLGSFPPSAPRMHFPYNRPLDSYVPDKASSPCQNMLELLHKVDQSRTDVSVMHSEPPEAENSDGSAGHTQRGQSFVSTGFGLQLGPPSHRLHIPDLSLPSQNARDAANSGHTGAEMGEKMIQTSSVHSLSFPTEGSQYENDGSSGSGLHGDDNHLYKAPSNYHLAYGSDTLHARSQLKKKQIPKGSGKIAFDEQTDSFSGNTLHSVQRESAETVVPDASLNSLKDNIAPYDEDMPGASDIQGRDPAETESTRDQNLSSQHSGALVISRQGGSFQVLQNMWNNVPSTQHPLPAQYLKAASHFPVQPQPNIVESSTHGDLHVTKVGHLSSELNAIHVNIRGVVDAEEHRLKSSPGPVASFVNINSTSIAEESLGKASSIKDNLEDSPANSASTQKDIEAFGLLLKPNAFSNKNYVVLNQMKALNDAKNDPSSRASKRIKGPDNNFDVSHVHLNAGQPNEDNTGDILTSSTVVPSDDSTMFNFSSSSNIMQRNTFIHGNIASHDIMVAGLDACQHNPSDFTTVRNHQVAPLMAPSWFNQYGPFKNGQMMPSYDAPKVASIRPNEPSSSLVKSSSILDVPNLENSTTAPIGACQVGGNLDSRPTSLSHEHLSSAQSLEMDVTGEHQVMSRPQKRKNDTTEFNPWHKKISDGSQNNLVRSEAEGDWSDAAICLSEKVQDAAELIEDGSPLLRSRRRLIFTTQLMQQLFRPPPRTIVSADDISTYESVTYAVSRGALGDACSAVACSSNLGHHHYMDLHSMKDKLNGDPHFAKVITELLGKARKLEDDFLRLYKSASVLELRVECQDLEKFSLINRFARFHGRGQPDISEASSGYGSGTPQNPHVQRYATAVAVPKSFPDRVHCLSL